MSSGRARAEQSLSVVRALRFEMLEYLVVKLFDRKSVYERIFWNIACEPEKALAQTREVALDQVLNNEMFFDHVTGMFLDQH